MQNTKHNLFQLAVCLDQLLRNVVGVIVGLFNGSKTYADETCSAWAYRVSKKYWYGRLFVRIINCLFLDENHCKHAYEHEIDLNHEYLDGISKTK